MRSECRAVFQSIIISVVVRINLGIFHQLSEYLDEPNTSFDPSPRCADAVNNACYSVRAAVGACTNLRGGIIFYSGGQNLHAQHRGCSCGPIFDTQWLTVFPCFPFVDGRNQTFPQQNCWTSWGLQMLWSRRTGKGCCKDRQWLSNRCWTPNLFRHYGYFYNLLYIINV